ncbi:transposase [Jannaschia formosa]|uniref:transposase n=1 Tax=Jannaschia formosa TaxID=2259592 RepID=UPI0035219372
MTVWLDALTPWHAMLWGRRDAEPVYGDALIQARLIIKVLFGLPLRQPTGFVAGLSRLAGLSIGRCRTTRRCAGARRASRCSCPIGLRVPLYLLVNSTVIKARGEAEWHAREHGGARRRVWLNVHLALDEATLEVRAVEITGRGVVGAPMLPGLLSQRPVNEPIGSVPADGPYDGPSDRPLVSRLPRFRDRPPLDRRRPRLANRMPTGAVTSSRRRTERMPTCLRTCAACRRRRARRLRP